MDLSGYLKLSNDIYVKVLKKEGDTPYGIRFHLAILIKGIQDVLPVTISKTGIRVSKTIGKRSRSVFSTVNSFNRFDIDELLNEHQKEIHEAMTTIVMTTVINDRYREKLISRLEVYAEAMDISS